jgi:galactose mutarotase-like enzyme
VRFGAAQGGGIDFAFASASHLGVWSKPGAPFLCIEPWRGVADPAGFAGELGDKPGVFVIAPGAAETLRMTIDAGGD